mgnify:CR=1 FL=1
MAQALWDDETKAEIREALSGMQKPVTLRLFITDGDDCEACETQRRLLSMMADLGDKLNLEVLDLDEEADVASGYGVDMAPATVPLGEVDYGIRFYGLTVGQEFSSLLHAVLMISTGSTGLEPGLQELVEGLDGPVDLKVFVTLTCPYCPKMVHAANQFAYANERIQAQMIEASEFLGLAQTYGVEGVPRTVINDTTAIEGTYPPGAFYLSILQEVDPAAYQIIEAQMRQEEGLRAVVDLEEGRIYDVVIVGGGPAGLSAALYAARKDLSVGLVAKMLGGQLLYTAQVDNYLGLPGIGGTELLQRFQFHVESYPIAELLGVTVTDVERAHDGFLVHLDDGREIGAHAVIYCAGKEYTRLGVPNEERFIGRGIAFCATCDAPLYRGRRVAVVGGGNSAFTAVRDLLGFASEIHLIHRRKRFRADAALVAEVQDHPKVSFHTPYEVRAFVGENALKGVEIVASGDGQTYVLDVDGVFLEIGLTPNSDAVSRLLALNDKGEIPVEADRSTALPGFFAAGDVTTVPEKQIAVAVGQGAVAALSAYEYLAYKGVVTRKPELEADWA